MGAGGGFLGPEFLTNGAGRAQHMCNLISVVQFYSVYAHPMGVFSGLRMHSWFPQKAFLGPMCRALHVVNLTKKKRLTCTMTSLRDSRRENAHPSPLDMRPLVSQSTRTKLEPRSSRNRWCCLAGCCGEGVVATT